MKRQIRTLALFCCAWLAGTSVSRASPLLEQMGGFGDMGGQQARLLSTGASAAYFNPALLTDAPTSFGGGVIVMGTRIAVSLLGTPGASYNVPTGVENATHGDGTPLGFYPLPTSLLQNGRMQSAAQGAVTARPRQGAGTGKQHYSYESVGIVVHFLDNKLAVGFVGLIPNRPFLQLRTFYADEREQFSTNSLHPELYGDRMTSLGFGIGLGYQLSKKLSLGLGAAVTFTASAAAPAYVADASRLDDLVLNVDVNAKAGLAPHGGILWRPIPRLRISATVHAPQQVKIGTSFRFVLASGVEQSSKLTWLFDWMPWQVGLGGAYDVIQRKTLVLTLATSAVYGRWSKYTDRHDEQAVDQFGWYDTITGAVGTRLVREKWSYGLDLQYKPTPIPLQQGRTNYVDNDRIGAIQSLEYSFPISGDTKLKIGAQLQLFWLLDRFQRKIMPPVSPDGIDRTPWLVRDELPDDAKVGSRAVRGAAGLQSNNPGFPGFNSKGWIASGGLYLALQL